MARSWRAVPAMRGRATYVVAAFSPVPPAETAAERLRLILRWRRSAQQARRMQRWIDGIQT